MKVVVIGGTAAGLSAASKAKRLRPELEITVFERTGYISYGACGLPYFVGDMIQDPNDLVSLFPEDVEKRGIRIFTHREVTKIDRTAKTVTVRDLESGSVEVWPYDRLVIATGASPIRLPIPGGDAKGVCYLRTVEDGIALKALAGASGTAVIIGGGFIGLELAEELTQRGVRVHLLEALPRLLPFLPEEFSALVLETLERNGVTVHTGTAAGAFLTESDRLRAVRTDSGEEIETELALVSVGVRPATQLAADCGLTLGLKGSIAVDEEQRTSDPDIWACGDCAETRNRITGQPAYVPLGTTANKQGRIAGVNVAGGHDRFPGILGSMVTKVFDAYIAATGLSLEQARQAGFDAAATQITKNERASYYPGGRSSRLSLVFEKGTGRLLGAQALGSDMVAGRINTLAATITAGMTVSVVNELDLVYAPPVAPVYDPILIAASQAIKHV